MSKAKIGMSDGEFTNMRFGQCSGELGLSQEVEKDENAEGHSRTKVPSKYTLKISSRT